MKAAIRHFRPRWRLSMPQPKIPCRRCCFRKVSSGTPGRVLTRPPTATTSPVCSPHSMATSGRPTRVATTSTAWSYFVTMPARPVRCYRSGPLSTATIPGICGKRWRPTRKRPAGRCWQSRTTATCRTAGCSPSHAPISMHV